MGVVSDADFEAELENSGIEELTTEVSVEDIKKGRGEGTKEVPEEIRELAGKSLINGEGTGKEVAAAYGISASSASAYKVGAHSTTTYHQPDASLAAKLSSHKSKISKKASSRLLSALNNITPDALATVKPRDLAAIAKDMASIVKDMEPPPPPASVSANQNVQFVFMAPKVRDVEDYKVIDVNE